jgi:hypothetical protein
VSISLEKLGDFLVRRGAPGDAQLALDHFERSLQLRELLARHNPGDAQAQRDVSVSYDKLTRHDEKAGNSELAVAYRRKDYDIAKRLHEADPDSAYYLEDLAISANFLAGLLTKHDEGAIPSEATSLLAACLQYLKKLDERGTLSANLQPLFKQLTQAFSGSKIQETDPDGN